MLRPYSIVGGLRLPRGHVVVACGLVSEALPVFTG